MTTRTRDTSLGVGVYFAPEDYVGILRRAVIVVVDLAVLVLLFFAVAVLGGVLNGTLTLVYLFCVWAYLTVVKASRIRTVGYRLTGARILNLRGTRPSVFRMTFRLLLWLLGPFNLVVDLLWSGIDKDRQTLCDRYAGTCVAKARAEPIGTAEVHLACYCALGLALWYPRVARPG